MDRDDKRMDADDRRGSKLSTIAPARSQRPEGFGSRPAKGQDEAENVRKAANTGHSGSGMGKPDPDRNTMAHQQRLNSASAREMKSMSDVSTTSHALSGSLKITDRKIGKR